MNDLADVPTRHCPCLAVAPGHGTTGSSLGRITRISSQSSPSWTSVSGGTSSLTLSGDSGCRLVTNANAAYSYTRSGGSGGATGGVYNYPLPTGNDNINRAYIYCEGGAGIDSLLPVVVLSDGVEGEAEALREHTTKRAVVLALVVHGWRLPPP